MKTTLTQQVIKSQYITELHKVGIKSIKRLGIREEQSYSINGISK